MPIIARDEESEEEEEEAKDFDYLLVQRSQLEALLTRRCVRCGKAKYERSTPSKRPRLSEHARKIIWKQRGTNMTATWTCSCYKKNKKSIRWAAQTYIEGTKTRQGNVAVVAAAAASPIALMLPERKPKNLENFDLLPCVILRMDLVRGEDGVFSEI